MTKTALLQTLIIIGGLYVVLCIFLYFFQEKLIFLPQKLNKDYHFSFWGQKFEEINVSTNDGTSLNCVLFKAQQPKGVILYLHGNAGSLSSWGAVAPTYTDLNYDLCLVDYRGYGKSEGKISSQEQLFEDNQLVYNQLKKQYLEDKIIVLGYSIGTGMASKLASMNRPKMLILQAPYYNLSDIMQRRFPVIPTLLLKYNLANNDYLKDCQMPVVVFHGDQDEIIYYGSSLKLQKEFKPQDTLITLSGQKHNGITENPDYREALKKILSP